MKAYQYLAFLVPTQTENNIFKVDEFTHHHTQILMTQINIHM
jgi:hypothetical protein